MQLKKFINAIQHPSETSAAIAPQGMYEIANDASAQVEIADEDINASECLPEPMSIKQIMRMSDPLKAKWMESTKKEVKVIVENDTSNTDDLPMPWAARR